MFILGPFGPESALRDYGLRLAQDGTAKAKKRAVVAGMDVTSLRGLWFWRLNSSSSSFCKSAARPFFSAASKAFMVGHPRTLREGWDS